MILPMINPFDIPAGMTEEEIDGINAKMMNVKKNYLDRLVSHKRGLKVWHLVGHRIYAINKKNALRKFNNIINK